MFDAWKLTTKENFCDATMFWNKFMFQNLMITLAGYCIAAYGLYKQEVKIFIRTLWKNRISEQSGFRYTNCGGDYLKAFKLRKEVIEETSWKTYFSKISKSETEELV